MPRRKLSSLTTLLLSLSLVPLAACGNDDGVDSDREARAAYIGLDGAIAKALGLGMDGFNAATSANIPDQSGTGDLEGTITVSGQVDAGASANKQMRLMLTLVDYKDEIADGELDIAYDTGDVLPALDLSLRGIPDGTFTGTLMATSTWRATSRARSRSSSASAATSSPPTARPFSAWRAPPRSLAPPPRAPVSST